MARGPYQEADKVLSPYSTVVTKKELPKVKARVKRIAHELYYPLEVIVAIEKAESEAEIDRIMHDARESRNNWYDKYGKEGE